MLQSGDVTLDLGARAFDVLLVLIDAAGAVVTKDELLRQVWPDAVVEENNLQVQISAVRRVLGADRELIRTVPRHGYRFAGPIAAGPIAARPSAAGPTAEHPTQPVAAQLTDAPTAVTRHSNLPILVGELIGREIDLLQLTELLGAHRLLTLTGPGGIGKTSLGLTVARRLIDRYPDGVFLVDLAALTDPDLVLPGVAAALDLRRLPLPVTAEQVAAALESRRLLLMLDNCEHVVEPVAGIAEALLHGAPRIQILATSREPLRADGECVYRVPSLAVPNDETADPDGHLRHAAVRLFVARARLADARLQIDDELVTVIGGICRRLDGIPLAIELAAARAAVLGVQGVAAGLDDRFRLLTGGRRTALLRHQTLRATIDWSYHLLDETERRVLCQLSVFAGSFTLDAAAAVAAPASGGADIADCIASLVARSLVGLESSGHTSRYRLLETMRAYGLDRLSAGETMDMRRRHLQFYTTAMQRAADEWRAVSVGGDRANYNDANPHPTAADTQPEPTSEWLAKHGGEIDNVRSALQWSLASDGAAPDDMTLGVALAVATMPLWLEASLHTECRQWAERALAIAGTDDTHQELVLQSARGSILLTTGGDSEQVQSTLQRSLTLAEAAHDSDYTLRALYNLWVHFLQGGDYVTAHSFAERFHAAAKLRNDVEDMLIGDRQIGASSHYLGCQDAARLRLEALTRSPAFAAQRSRESRFGLDQQVVAWTMLARVLALQGEIDHARELAGHAVDVARRLNRVASECSALGELCVIALWTGNTTGLADTVARLLGLTTRYGLRFWRAHALVAQGVLAASQAAVAEAASAFDAAADDAGWERFDLRYPSLLGTLAEGLTAIGRPAQARTLVNQALERPGAMQKWCATELLIVRGNLTMASGRPAAEATAEEDFTRALRGARQQPALLLELRAAVGLAQLAAHRGRPQEGEALLDGVYTRFTEGLDTARLQDAQALLVALREAQQQPGSGDVGDGAAGDTLLGEASRGLNLTRRGPGRP